MVNILDQPRKNVGEVVVKVEAAAQGVDDGFKFTGSFDDSIEFGEVTVAKAGELMRELPDQGSVRREYPDQGDVSREYLEGEGELCPPRIHLTRVGISRHRQLITAAGAIPHQVRNP